MDSKAIIGNAMEEVLDEEFAEYINDLPLYTGHQFSERHNRKMSKQKTAQAVFQVDMYSRTQGCLHSCCIYCFICFSFEC